MAVALGLTPVPEAFASGWAVRLGNQGKDGVSATLPTTETWAVQAPTGKRALATLTLRCRPGTEISASVAFPGLTSGRELWIRYAFGGYGRHAHRAAPEAGPRLSAWLGRSDVVRDLATAEVLEIAIDDPDFGLSEAVFHLARVGEIIRRLHEACRVPAAMGPSTPPHPRGAEAEPRRGSPPQKAVKKALPEQRTPAPAGGPGPMSPGGEPNPAAEPTPPAPPPSDRPGPAPEAPAAGPKSAEPNESVKAPSPPPQDQEGAKVGPDTDTAPEEPSAPLPSPPPGERTDRAPAPEPPSIQPPSGDEAREGRLPAFIQKYGPNREGELVYGWYRQCLEAAGIDRTQVWYLSNEELAYLSKGETDQVRLSLLVSTDHSLDAPPRRVTCYGTARGRELTIDRAE